MQMNQSTLPCRSNSNEQAPNCTQNQSAAPTSLPSTATNTNTNTTTAMDVDTKEAGASTQPFTAANSSLSTFASQNLAQLQQLLLAQQGSQQAQSSAAASAASASAAVSATMDSLQLLEQQIVQQLLRQQSEQAATSQLRQLLLQQQMNNNFMPRLPTLPGDQHAMSSLLGCNNPTANSGPSNLSLKDAGKTEDANQGRAINATSIKESAESSASSMTNEESKYKEFNGKTDEMQLQTQESDKEDEGDAKSVNSGEGDHANDTFPFKVFRMLAKVENDNQESIVSFTASGRAFRIHKPTEFATQIMPEFFTTSRMSSFQRQLNLYGFRRITEGADKGAYCHDCFRKDNMALCRKIKRKRNTVKARPGVFGTLPSSMGGNRNIGFNSSAALDASSMTIRQLLASQLHLPASANPADGLSASSSALTSLGALSEVASWQTALNRHLSSPSSLAAALSLNQKAVQQHNQMDLIQKLLQSQQLQHRQQQLGNAAFQFM